METSDKIVITGGAGLVGQNLIVRLKQRGFARLVAIDKHDANTATLRRLHPDIVQSHYIKSHFLLWLSGESRRYRWVAFQHGYTLTSSRLLLYKQLDRLSLPRADRVLTVSQAFARHLQQRGVPPDKLKVLHNAVDPKWGERARDAELRARARAELGIEGPWARGS